MAAIGKYGVKTLAMGFLLFILFLGIPLAEIALFVVIGEQIGILATIAIVILTAIAGAALVRQQGFSTLQRARRDVEENRIPAGAMAEGLAILVAGAMLLTPGFLTDAIGFTLLIPPLRRTIISWIRRWFAARVTVMGMNDNMGGFHGQSPRGPHGGGPFEGGGGIRREALQWWRHHRWRGQ